jgi:hypothetical protein
LHVVAERLQVAATAVAQARYALPAWAGWEHWHEFLYDLESALADAAEQVNGQRLLWEREDVRREFWNTVIQAVANR